MYKLPLLQELLEAGVHFGHQVRRGHPRMRPYIYGARDGVHVIDLTQSEKYLKEACEYVYKLGTDGGILLFVGTKKQAQPIVEESAKRLETPYMMQRWIGGFLTNFEEISKNIKKLKEFQEQKSKGELSKYTKKEQLLIERKMDKLSQDFAGVMDLSKLPDAIFVIDTVMEKVAVREANKMGIPVVAIADSNSDPTLINYLVPGNDDAIKSIKILTEAIADAYEQGKKDAKVASEKRAEKEKVELEEKTAQQLAEEVAEAEEKMEKEALKEASRKID